MKNTGRLLKEKRESANLSLSEVALATKINPKILAAIEAGQEAALPAKTFLKGFIRSYAQFLKMDIDSVLRSYQEESGPPPVETVHEAYRKGDSSPAPASRRRVNEENSSGMRTVAVVVIVLLIGLIIGVREMIEKYQREKVTESAETIKVSPLLQPPVIVSADKPSPEIMPPVETTPTPQVLPKEEPEKAAVREEKPPSPATVTETKTTEAAPPGAKGFKSEIIIEALDKVEVKFNIRGENKTLSLGPTQVHTIHSEQPVSLEISDGGAVNIIVNGRDRGVPGELGKPKTLKIP